MSFYAYMLRCSDDSYYVGHTEELEGRIAAHQSGQIPGYTQMRRPLQLVWSQDFHSREEALAAERQIKGWSRAKKEALIRSDWESLSLLASRSKILRDAGSTGSPATQDERVCDTVGSQSTLTLRGVSVLRQHDPCQQPAPGPVGELERAAMRPRRGIGDSYFQTLTAKCRRRSRESNCPSGIRERGQLLSGRACEWPARGA